ncbi:MAG: hypothetical protein WC587_00825 [Candidatus Paceibacterota bacterium]
MKKRNQAQTGIALIEIVLTIMIITVIGGIIYFYWQKNINYTEIQQIESQQQAVQQKFECNLSPKENYIIVNGKVNFPRGIKNYTDYEIVVASDTYKISLDGNFCASVPNGVFIIGVSSSNENDFSLLSVIVSEKDTDIIINSKTTAVGLLFTTPYFLNNDPVKATEIIKQIENNSKVKILSDQIENKETLSINDIENRPISDAFKNALNSVLGTKNDNNNSKIQPQVINFEMTIKPANYYKNQKGESYIYGKLIDLDKNAQIEFKKYLATKYFDVGSSQIRVDIINDTKFLGKQPLDDYNNFEVKIKGYIISINDIDKVRIIANEIFVF